MVPKVGYCNPNWHPGMNIRGEAFGSGEQTFVPKLVNMYNISELLIFLMLDNSDTELVINQHEEDLT